jgi:NADH:ubiquinone oxidoreductase subunit 6 (subunit J)
MRYYLKYLSFYFYILQYHISSLEIQKFCTKQHDRRLEWLNITTWTISILYILFILVQFLVRFDTAEEYQERSKYLNALFTIPAILMLILSLGLFFCAIARVYRSINDLKLANENADSPVSGIHKSYTLLQFIMLLLVYLVNTVSYIISLKRENKDIYFVELLIS